MVSNSKLFWDINEVAEKFSVKASTIRYYETKFDLKIKRDRAGDRRFIKEDLDRLEKIFTLVEGEGLTLEKAKERFRQKEKFMNEKDKIIYALKNFKGILQAVLEDLPIK